MACTTFACIECDLSNFQREYRKSNNMNKHLEQRLSSDLLFLLKSFSLQNAQLSKNITNNEDTMENIETKYSVFNNQFEI